MNSERLKWNKNLLVDSANEINRSEGGFTKKFFAAQYLDSISRQNPELINAETISALMGVLKNENYGRERRGFLLFKQAAEALTAIMIHGPSETFGEEAFAAFKRVLASISGLAHRASTEALGGLPCAVNGPKLSQKYISNVPSLDWKSILGTAGAKISDTPVFKGRNLVIKTDDGKGVAVLKLARTKDSPQGLLKEIQWMEYLRNGAYSFPMRFDIPVPIEVDGAQLFKLSNMPTPISKNIKLHSEVLAIGYVADKDYFTYPNDSRFVGKAANGEFEEVIIRNAWLLGKLASEGMVHAAPLPLFHNRIQRSRRNDQGLYEWFRAGRLDRWLDSCDYPNLGLTGIRDFEHFESIRGMNQGIYRYIGNHFLSLMLLAGSYFRNRDRGRVGLDKDGEPVDARDLFDEQILKRILHGIFENYYEGFVGSEYEGTAPLDVEKLCSRMIEEMGVDRHMEEILRVIDQNEMGEDKFRDFLKRWGYSEEESKRRQRGARDITINSGPHLGAFNDTISLPELIEAAGTMAAMCIAGKYRAGIASHKPCNRRAAIKHI